MVSPPGAAAVFTPPAGAPSSSQRLHREIRSLEQPLQPNPMITRLEPSYVTRWFVIAAGVFVVVRCATAAVLPHPVAFRGRTAHVVRDAPLPP